MLAGIAQVFCSSPGATEIPTWSIPSCASVPAGKVLVKRGSLTPKTGLAASAATGATNRRHAPPKKDSTARAARVAHASALESLFRLSSASPKTSPPSVAPFTFSLKHRIAMRDTCKGRETGCWWYGVRWRNGDPSSSDTKPGGDHGGSRRGVRVGPGRGEIDRPRPLLDDRQGQLERDQRSLFPSRSGRAARFRAAPSHPSRRCGGLLRARGRVRHVPRRSGGRVPGRLVHLHPGGDAPRLQGRRRAEPEAQFLFPGGDDRLLRRPQRSDPRRRSRRAPAGRDRAPAFDGGRRPGTRDLRLNAPTLGGGSSCKHAKPRVEICRNARPDTELARSRSAAAFSLLERFACTARFQASTLAASMSQTRPTFWAFSTPARASR